MANVAGAVIHILFERPTLNWLHQLGSSVRLPEVRAGRQARDDGKRVSASPMRAGKRAKVESATLGALHR
jgi:hypothetical protein